MLLHEACNELKAKGCGRVLGCSREDAEDGGLIIYLDYEPDLTLTVLLPPNIRDQSLDERRETVMNATSSLIHGGMA